MINEIGHFALVIAFVISLFQVFYLLLALDYQTRVDDGRTAARLLAHSLWLFPFPHSYGPSQHQIFQSRLSRTTRIPPNR